LKIKIQKHLAALQRDFVGDFWTSGVRDGPEKNFLWTARKKAFGVQGTKWKSGEPSENGDCVYLESRNSTENTSLVIGDCALPKKFICEVNFSDGIFIINIIIWNF